MGNKHSYSSIHHWIINKFGKASQCMGDKCNKRSNNYQWALKKGCDYDKDIDNFIQLCCSCHKLYDTTPEQRIEISKKRIKTLHTEESKRKISEKLKGIPKTIEHNMKVSIANKGKKRTQKCKDAQSRRTAGVRRTHTCTPVSKFDLNGNLIQSYDCITDASKHTSILITSISNNLHNLSKTAGGYTWKFQNK